MQRSIEQEWGVHHDGWVYQVGAVGQATQRQQAAVGQRRVDYTTVTAAAGDAYPR